MHENLPLLADNPLEDPLPELLERRMPALLQYLRSLADSTLVYETKLVLVGEGNVGKTSLVEALLGSPFVLNRPTTHGIEVKNIALPHPSGTGEVIDIRSWDFEGDKVIQGNPPILLQQEGALRPGLASSRGPGGGCG